MPAAASLLPARLHRSACAEGVQVAVDLVKTGYHFSILIKVVPLAANLLPAFNHFGVIAVVIPIVMRLFIIILVFIYIPGISIQSSTFSCAIFIPHKIIADLALYRERRVVIHDTIPVKSIIDTANLSHLICDEFTVNHIVV